MWLVIFNLFFAIGIASTVIGIVNLIRYICEHRKLKEFKSGCQQCGNFIPAGYQFCSSICENKWLETQTIKNY